MLADSPEPSSPTGRYPGPVWAQALHKKTLGTTEDAPADAPSATGIYPGPVWDAAGGPAPSAAGNTPDTASRNKEADYSRDLDEAPDAETEDRGDRQPLDNREIYRIVREVAVGDSGDDLYAAVNPQDGFGLCFGLVLFTQVSGDLGAVLRLMQQRNDNAFRQTFGDQADGLLEVTGANDPQDRLAPVGGDNLWAPVWLDRFRKAGAVPAFQAAQNEHAIEGLFRPMLRYAFELGIDTDRALAMMFDRVVTRGLGGGLRWVVRVAGPLRRSEQRRAALEALGFDSVRDFQESIDWLSPSGVFGPDTHAALAGALRRAGEMLLPRAEDYICRMVSGADGTARERLERLRDSDNLEDVQYRSDAD